MNDPGNQLLNAAENNEIEVVKCLIGEDASLVNTTDSDGYTPLHRAAYNNHLDIVKVLLANGAKVDARTNDGWQPLHSASYWNNVNVASFLLQNGADINAQTNGGQTPLHLAAALQEGREILLLFLTNPSLDATIVNSCNETAYQVAYRCSKYSNLFEMIEPSVNHM